MDADSLAFFEYNLPIFFKKNGSERAKHKIKFMYVRISEKAKALVKKMNFQDKEIERVVKESIS